MSDPTPNETDFINPDCDACTFLWDGPSLAEVVAWYADEPLVFALGKVNAFSAALEKVDALGHELEKGPRTEAQVLAAIEAHLELAKACPSDLREELRHSPALVRLMEALRRVAFGPEERLV